MNCLIGIVILLTSMNSQMIFDFNKDSDLQDWIIVNDNVMGGESLGILELSADGFGVFEGSISLENNGGFSSVRYQFKKINVKEYTKIIVRLRGDGKKYQLRIKPTSGNYYSYVAPFSTSGEWQEIEIHLKDMYPTFRGRKLDRHNFSDDSIEEIALFMGNKKSEKFKLLIDKIELH